MTVVTLRLANLLADPGLGLQLLTGETSGPVTWAHGSDLLDPTPFLEPGNLLLTTGTQFPDDASSEDYARYVDRLHDRGVGAVGFGTDVVRLGTPEQLVAACAASDVALIAVPYRTPFIAIAKRVADYLATAAHARDAWTLQAQRALSLAALSPGRISRVLDELARQLAAGVLLLDARGNPVSAHGRMPREESAVEAIAADARRLLRGRRRTGAALAVGDQLAFVQTLGRRHELRGALAVTLPERPDAAATAVITSAVALAEFALDDATRQHKATIAFHAQLLVMLLAGHTDDVRLILAASDQPLPDRGLRVLVTRLAGAAVADLQHTLDLTSGGAGTVVAPWDDLIVAVAGGSAVRDVAEYLAGAERTRVAVSPEVDWSSLAGATRDTRNAFERSTEIELVEAVRPELLALLPPDPTLELARRRLEPLLTHPDGARLLEVLSTWLRHNGAWEPAARSLHVHRHTLKHQVGQAAELIDLDLSRFGNRAELWILLETLSAADSRYGHALRTGSTGISAGVSVDVSDGEW